jgi:anti-anti-sigma factor
VWSGSWGGTGRAGASTGSANIIGSVLNFDLQIESEGKSVLITIRGDFDLQVAERVADELARIELSEPERMVIDLRRLSFMDSRGMGVIASAHFRAVAAHREFVVVAPPAGVMRAFQISRLADVVTIVEDVTEVYP